MLSQLNNDLINLLNSVNLPLVMVSSDLSVRRFTPQAADVLGLVPSDVGRPIPRLKLKVEVNDLERMMLDVLKDVQPRHYRVKDSEGSWCTFRFTPYRTVDNRVDGVVLSVMDLNDSGNMTASKSRTNNKNKKASNKEAPAKRKGRS